MNASVETGRRRLSIKISCFMTIVYALTMQTDQPDSIRSLTLRQVATREKRQVMIIVFWLVFILMIQDFVLVPA
ncbi:MAG: hypothetical protein HKN34_08090 [Gammaproteobacteria bacterium]|nr:hypothetical protein [Gammaproteobacteria bacterium]